MLKADAVALADLEQEAAEEVSLAIAELQKARVDIRVEEPSPEIHQISSDTPKGESDLENFNEESIMVEVKPGSSKTSALWNEAEKLVGAEQYMVKFGKEAIKRKLNTGSWYNPYTKLTSIGPCSAKRMVENFIPSGVLSKIAKSESYAVVTFTSRQAAIAARQCLSDGSGLEGWREVDKIPVPPLADAVPWNIFDCRGCCRPVTVSIAPQQKRFRFKM